MLVEWNTSEIPFNLHNMEKKKFKFFEEEIFYGNCSPNGDGITEREMAELQRQIDEVHSINSGLQQPSHCSSEDAQLVCNAIDEALFRLKVKLGNSIKTALGI